DADGFCQRMPAEELEDDPPPALPLHLLAEPYRAAVPVIERLIETFHHISVHPGGLVIGEPRIDCHAPMERALKGVRVTQFDMRGVARLGLAKIDLLGNRALSAIHDTCEALGATPEMPDGDPTTLATLHEARTVG